MHTKIPAYITAPVVTPTNPWINIVRVIIASKRLSNPAMREEIYKGTFLDNIACILFVGRCWLLLELWTSLLASS
jgi:hypothetical protein